MSSILQFAANHPALMTAIVWPLLTAILTAIFKPQTQEQYVRLAIKHPRLADFWRFIGAIGFDPVKAVLVLRQLATPIADKDPLKLSVSEDTYPGARDEVTDAPRRDK